MIGRFRGQYRFLSNFYVGKSFCHRGIYYNSVESFFQAQKTKDIKEIRRIALMQPAEAKKAGREIFLRDDWEEIKLKVMYRGIKLKFSEEPLKSQLLSTGEEMLVEGNTWGDVIWGYDINKKKGTNLLGKTLMKVRKELQISG